MYLTPPIGEDLLPCELTNGDKHTKVQPRIRKWHHTLKANGNNELQQFEPLLNAPVQRLKVLAFMFILNSHKNIS